MEAINAISTILSIGRWITYFGKLMPIKIVPTVELKDEWVIDLRSCPHLTIQAEEKEKEQTEKVAGVNLYLLLRFPVVTKGADYSPARDSSHQCSQRGLNLTNDQLRTRFLECQKPIQLRGEGHCERCCH